ncbi:MAG TPA: hypothetical protein EYO73_06205 [Sulfurimonas sp.]|nr:hypothetical protein [Sulfurimonas sp.]
MANDFEMWREKNINQIWPEHTHSKVILQRITKIYNEVKNKPKSYDGFDPSILRSEQKFSFTTKPKEGFGLGMCPVASEGTRCCKIITFDAVESCGFDCSYCTIQSFYKEEKITFDSGFKDKLRNIQLDSNKTYHIGTLTFIKPVINKLRQRNFNSKILQMPFDNAAGKASYPLSIKEEMFKYAYESFKPWHKKVFFYLCMEDHSLWKKCFGYEYYANVDLERAMVSSYCEKTEMQYIYS